MFLRYSGVILALFLSLSQVTLAVNFGVRGRDGRDGYPGANGKDAQSTVLRATGQAVALNLSGSYAGNGQPGERAEDAWNCSQPRPDYDLYGADGGDGGNGGPGGSGGDAGDITIFTNNVANLKAVLVQAVGGQGGYGGPPGSGGRGCYCTYRQWIIPHCKIVTDPQGNKKQVCQNVVRRCWDGNPGRMGYAPPAVNRHGRNGRLTLIKQLNDLDPVTPSITIGMAQVLTGPFQLSDNVWLSKSGALSLLANGSQLENNYYEFSHKQNFQYSFGWEARRPLSEFGQVNIQLVASTDTNRVNVYVPGEVWFSAREEMVQGMPRMTFEKVLLAKEATQLVMRPYGDGTNFSIDIDDLADVSDLVNTHFDIDIERDGLFGNPTLFKGPMPVNYIDFKGAKFTLRIGQIPGIDLDYLKKGKKLEIRVKAQRSLVKFSANKDFDIEHKIPKD